MTKLTIVTDRHGKLIGAVQGHVLSQKVGDLQAEVSFEPGHMLHMVDVDIDLAEFEDPKRLQTELARLVRKPPRATKPRSARQKP